VPEAAVKFVHREVFKIKAINGERGTGNVTLTSIAHVLNVMASGGMGIIEVSWSHQVFSGKTVQSLTAKFVIAPVEPFEGHLGLVDLISQSAQGFTGNAVGSNAVHAKMPIAGRGNRHVFEGVESL